MTTVAFDGKTLAADTMVTVGGSATYGAIKIGRAVDGSLIGQCGNMAHAQAFLEWYNGERKMLPSTCDNYTALIIKPDGEVRVYEGNEGMYYIERSPYVAIGSGQDFAQSAMELGFNAVRAVELAIKMDINTGGKVDTLEFGIS